MTADHRDVTEGYAISKQYTARAEVIRKEAENLLLAERAEARLSELRKADPLTTYEQAVTVVLDEDPGLYGREGCLMLSRAVASRVKGL